MPGFFDYIYTKAGFVPALSNNRQRGRGLRVRRSADYLYMVAGGVVLVLGVISLFFPEVTYHTAKKAPGLPGIAPGEEHRSISVPALYAIGFVALGLLCLYKTYMISRRSKRRRLK